MGHVMVPCPEEHVDELRMELMRLTLGMGGWSDATAEEFLTRLEGDDRLLVLAVAKAAAEHERLSYTAAARYLDSDVGSVLDRVTSVNALCHRTGWPMPLITETDQLGTEPADGAKPVLTMVRPVALRLLGRMDLGDPDEKGPPRGLDLTEL